MWWSAFKLYLRKENPWGPKLLRQAKMSVGGMPKVSLLQALNAHGNVSDIARILIEGPEFAILQGPVEIEFGWAEVASFGFIEPPTKAALCARIEEMGQLCEREDGPYVWLGDSAHRPGMEYHFPMKSMDYGGDPKWWCGGRGSLGGRALMAQTARLNLLIPLDCVVVFRRRRY
jgi:hypothetical protein